MEFPRMTYRLGGREALESGMFSVHVAQTQDEYEAMKRYGWRLDQYAAKSAGSEPVQPDPSPAQAADKAAEPKRRK